MDVKSRACEGMEASRAAESDSVVGGSMVEGLVSGRRVMVVGR